jgi:hypothetical protein
MDWGNGSSALFGGKLRIVTCRSEERVINLLDTVNGKTLYTVERERGGVVFDDAINCKAYIASMVVE